jgi:hypothetical protein
MYTHIYISPHIATHLFACSYDMIGDMLVNLTKYLAEVANAVVEVKLVKPADVNKCVQICSAMVQRYTEFTAVLIPPLLRFFGLTKNPTLKRLPDTPTPNIAEDDAAYVCSFDHSIHTHE